MANVVGLQTVQEANLQGSAKKGRVSTNYNKTNRISLTPSARPIDTYTGAPAVQQDENAQRLASALSSLSPVLGQLAVNQHEAKEKEQLSKLKYYTEQFTKDKQSGAVNATQVKEQFPELVSTVAARVAQATGEMEAKTWVQNKIQSVLEDDNLRLSTKNRRAYLDQVKAEALEQIGDNEFYGTGFLNQLDSSINEFETSWMRETASYHEKVQADSFSTQVASTLRTGGDLKALDRAWKSSSSLNNVQRNELVVSAAINEAIASNDFKVLDKVPERFLNAESKKKIVSAKQQIQTDAYTQFVRSKALSDYERDTQIREGKVGILEKVANGESFKATDYYQTPELFSFASSLLTSRKVDATRSSHSAATFKTNLLRAGTTGDYLTAFEGDAAFANTFRDDETVSIESLRDHIMTRTDMSASDKKALIDNIPVYMDGVNFLKDPWVSNSYSTVENSLQSFMSQPQGAVLQVRGVNPEVLVKDEYNNYIMEEMNAYIEENNSVPTGTAKRDIIRGAKEAALNKLQFLQQNFRTATNETPQQQQPQSQTQNSETTPKVIKRWNPETKKLEVVNE